MDLEGELGRVHEVEANQEIFWKKYRETLLFLAARIMKSHRKGKKKLLKEKRSRKREVKPRGKKKEPCLFASSFSTQILIVNLDLMYLTLKRIKRA